MRKDVSYATPQDVVVCIDPAYPRREDDTKRVVRFYSRSYVGSARSLRCPNRSQRGRPYRAVGEANLARILGHAAPGRVHLLPLDPGDQEPQAAADVEAEAAGAEHAPLT